MARLEAIRADLEAEGDGDPRTGWAAAGIDARDVGSLINPNSVRVQLFSVPVFRDLILPGRSARELQQMWVDGGLSLHISPRYDDIFTRAALENYLGPWGAWNLDTMDEFALEQVFAQRTGDARQAAAFHARVRESLASSTSLNRDSGIFLGQDASMRPLFHVEGIWNVNTVPELLLEGILAYPAWNLGNHGEIAQAILGLRQSEYLGLAALHRIVGAPDDCGVWNYLGCRTLAWEFTVPPAAGGSGSTVAVFVRTGGTNSHWSMVSLHAGEKP